MLRGKILTGLFCPTLQSLKSSLAREGLAVHSVGVERQSLENTSDEEKNECFLGGKSCHYTDLSKTQDRTLRTQEQTSSA